MTDYGFYCPTILSDQSIALYASHVPVYSYIFNHSAPSRGSEPPSVLQYFKECRTHACKLASTNLIWHTCITINAFHANHICWVGTVHQCISENASVVACWLNFGTVIKQGVQNPVEYGISRIDIVTRYVFFSIEHSKSMRSCRKPYKYYSNIYYTSASSRPS